MDTLPASAPTVHPDPFAAPSAAEPDVLISAGREAFPGEPGPCPEDLAWAAESFARKYGGPDDVPATAADLMASIAGYLAGLGFAPDVQRFSIGLEFNGRLHRIEIEDVETRFAEPESSDAPTVALAAEMDWPPESGIEERREAMADLVRFFRGNREV